MKGLCLIRTIASDTLWRGKKESFDFGFLPFSPEGCKGTSLAISNTTMPIEDRKVGSLGNASPLPLSYIWWTNLLVKPTPYISWIIRSWAWWKNQKIPQKPLQMHWVHHQWTWWVSGGLARCPPTLHLVIFHMLYYSFLVHLQCMSSEVWQQQNNEEVGRKNSTIELWNLFPASQVTHPRVDSTHLQKQGWIISSAAAISGWGSLSYILREAREDDRNGPFRL